jgi:hypothetical protein
VCGATSDRFTFPLLCLTLVECGGREGDEGQEVSPHCRVWSDTRSFADDVQFGKKKVCDCPHTHTSYPTSSFTSGIRLHARDVCVCVCYSGHPLSVLRNTFCVCVLQRASAFCATADIRFLWYSGHPLSVVQRASAIIVIVVTSGIRFHARDVECNMWLHPLPFCCSSEL